MRVKSFLILSVVTVIMVVAAVAAVMMQPRPETQVATGEKLFPDLLDRVDEIASIRLRNGHDTVTIRRLDDGWGLEEKSNYPVRRDRVRELLLALGGIEKIEAKTDRPERYATVGVESLDQPDAGSKELIVADADGNSLAALIVGHAALRVGEDGGRYVRKPDEDMVWLVRGRLDAKLETREWLDKRIIDVEPEAIRSVQVRHPDGEMITASRANVDAPYLALDTLPEGADSDVNHDADSLSTVLSVLDFDDLEPVDSIPFGELDTIEAVVTTFDGFVVAVDLVSHDGGQWIRITADGGGSTTDNQDGAAPVQTAEEINARTGSWAFRVPSYKIAPLRRRLDDFAKDNPSPS